MTFSLWFIESHIIISSSLPVCFIKRKGNLFERVEHQPYNEPKGFVTPETSFSPQCLCVCV